MGVNRSRARPARVAAAAFADRRPSRAIAGAAQFIAHLPLRHEPLPQSEFELHVPSGELAHLPLRHDAPPQSEFELHVPPCAVAHTPLRQLTPGPQSELLLHPPPPAAHLPLRQEPAPQSELLLHVPSGAFAHLPLRHDAPPQSEFELHEPPMDVAHLPLRQLTPGPQSEFELHDPPEAAAGEAGSAASARATMEAAKATACLAIMGESFGFGVTQTPPISKESSAVAARVAAGVRCPRTTGAGRRTGGA